MATAQQPFRVSSPAPRRARAPACIGGMVSGMDPRKLNTAAAHFLMIGANAAFGALNVWMKVVITDQNEGMKPVIFGLYRDLAVLPLLMIWTTLTGGWRSIASYSDAGNMVLLGVSGIGLFQACHLIGLQWVGPDTASCYNPGSAILSAAFAVFPWRYERPSWRKAIGSLVGLAGMAIVVFTKDDREKGEGRYLEGNIWCFCGALAGSLSFLLQKPLLRKYSSRMTLAVAYVPAVTVLALFSVRHVLTDGSREEASNPWEVKSSALLPLCVSVVISGAGFLTMLWANKFLDASISASYCVVQPLAAELAKTVLDHNPPDFGDLGGCLLLLLALVAVSSKNETGSHFLS